MDINQWIGSRWNATILHQSISYGRKCGNSYEHELWVNGINGSNGFEIGYIYRYRNSLVDSVYNR